MSDRDPPLLRGRQRLPESVMESLQAEAEAAREAAAPTADPQHALARAFRSTAHERLPLRERRRALAEGLGLSQRDLQRYGVARALSHLDDAVAAAEEAMRALTFTLPPALVEQLAEVVTLLVADRLAGAAATPPPPSPYLTVKDAAAYIGAKEQRIYDLLTQRKLTRYKEGGRTLVLREELDALIRAATARR